MKTFILILVLSVLSWNAATQKLVVISDPLDGYVAQYGDILAGEKVTEIFATTNVTGFEDTIRRFKLNKKGPLVASGYGNYLSGLEFADCEDLYDCTCLSQKTRDSIICDGKVLIRKKTFGFWMFFEYNKSGLIERIIFPPNQYLDGSERLYYYTPDGLLDSVIHVSKNRLDSSRLFRSTYIFRYDSLKRLVLMKEEPVNLGEYTRPIAEYRLRYEGALPTDVTLVTFDGDSPLNLRISYSRLNQ